jgi:hypothetical protein
MFNSAASTLFIPASTSPWKINVYFFSGTVTCADIATNGWGTGCGSGCPANGTKYLEVSLQTPSPGTYMIDPNMAMSAFAPYSTVTAGANDVSPTGGTVTTTEYTAKSTVSGCFDVTYATGTLSGTFHNPTYCPSGQEP